MKIPFVFDTYYVYRVMVGNPMKMLWNKTILLLTDLLYLFCIFYIRPDSSYEIVRYILYYQYKTNNNTFVNDTSTCTK